MGEIRRLRSRWVGEGTGGGAIAVFLPGSPVSQLFLCISSLTLKVSLFLLSGLSLVSASHRAWQYLPHLLYLQLCLSV